MTSKTTTPELDDLKDKAHGAKQAAKAPDASERDKADHKLLEQEVVAAKMRAKHEDSPTAKKDTKLDKALKASFPGSDPVAATQPQPAPKHGEKPHGEKP